MSIGPFERLMERSEIKRSPVISQESINYFCKNRKTYDPPDEDFETEMAAARAWADAQLTQARNNFMKKVNAKRFHHVYTGTLYKPKK